MFKRWFKAKNYNSLLLIGCRRAGKTTYLRHTFPDYSYVTLDDFDLLTWAKKDPKGFVQHLGCEAIIDEIQRVPELTIAVKQRIDQGAFKVIMTGSSSLGLLSSSADTLAGRISIAHFPTVCWGEEKGEPTHSFFDDVLTPAELLEGKREFENALSYGGFPEIVSQEAAQIKAELLRNYRDTYFTRDLAQLSNIENVDGVRAILNHLGRSIGSQLEVSSFAKESGLSHPTAKKYLNVFTQSELTFKLYGYQYGPAKRYLKAAKFYFSDAGILHSLRQDESKGQRIENFVISEIEKRRKLGTIMAEELFYYSSSSRAEIDILFKDSDFLRITEIKASETIAQKDLRNLRDYVASQRNANIRASVVYLGTEYRTIEGIRCIPVYALYRGK